MLDLGTAQEIADRFELGSNAVLSGPAARGELGQVWELRTSNGRFAVKESFDVFDERDGEDAEFEEAAREAGVPAPEVVRAADGSLIAPFGGVEIRVFGWVDLCERDAQADPARVGALVGALHCVPFRGARPTDPWYASPVGADRWDALIRDLRAAGAPFAEPLAAYRD